MVNFKAYDVMNWETNNYNTHYLKKEGNMTMKSGQLIEYNVRNIFLEKSCKNQTGILVPDLFFVFKKALY